MSLPIFRLAYGETSSSQKRRPPNRRPGKAEVPGSNPGGGSIPSLSVSTLGDNMTGRNGNTDHYESEVSSETLPESKLNTTGELDELGISLLLELLDKNIEKRDDIKIMKKREGKGYGFYIRIPAEVAKKFKLYELLKDRSSVETKAIIDYDNWALTVKIPKEF